MTPEEISAIQKKLRVPEDSIWGPKSIKASIQYLKKLQQDSGFDVPLPDEKSMTAFFGPPGQADGISPQLAAVKVPFRMWYYGKLVPEIFVHIKIVEPVKRALKNIADVYPNELSRDQSGASLYCGCYNPRFIRGSKTAISKHAWAAALDFDDARNGLFSKWPERAHMPWELMECWAAAGFKPLGAIMLRDAMHFEFTQIVA